MGYTCGRRWTDELLAQEAKKYKTRSEFQHKDPGAYRTAKTRNILNEICRHMVPISFSIPQRICQQILDHLLQQPCEYNTRKIVTPFELDLYYPSYNLAIEYRGKGWHLSQDAINRDAKKQEICLTKGITLIIIVENNRKYESDIKNQIIQKLDIINSASGLSLTADAVMSTEINYSTIFDVDLKLDNIKNAILTCKNIAEFKRKYITYYNIIRKSGLIHLLEPIRKCYYRTNEELIEECLKITHYHDLITKHNAIYNACHKRGILKEVTKHMIKSKREPYTIDEVINLAKGCKSRGEFKKSFNGAYHKARKLNLIEKLFPIRMKKRLTKEQVVEIRKMYKLGHKIKELADKFDVSTNCISGVVHRFWKHI